MKPSAIIIDNGSYQCRVGWISDKKPCMIFRNLVAKNRNKKDLEIQVGNDISNIEHLRWLMKTQFDRNVVAQFDIQEQIYDYIFSHLGINTPECVNYPIVLTEAICNPSHSRQLMSELLFECYQVPKIVYGIDAGFSFNYNIPKSRGSNGLIISISHYTTHILPVLQGQIDFPQCRRINIGGTHMTGFLHHYLQLKYPSHFSAINLTRCEELLQQHTRVATHYEEELEKWIDYEYYNQNVHKIELPHTPLSESFSPSGGKMERCLAMLKQLQELNAEQRAETLAMDEEKLQHFLTLQELLEDDEDDLFVQRSMNEFGLKTTEDLQMAIDKVNLKIQKTKSYIPYFCFGDSDQESEAKQMCCELQLRKFSEPEAWIKAVKQKCEELRRSVIKSEQPSPSKQKFINRPFPRKSEFGTEFIKQSEIQTKDESEIIRDQEKLQELEGIVRAYDREYNRKPIIGTEPNFSFSLAEYYQLHMGIEQIRVPETLFQPSMIGIDQAGVAETMEVVLSCYPPEVQLNLVENVFLTGGCASIPGFKERIESELLKMRPFQSPFRVYLADDPVLDAWQGARLWSCQNDNLKKYSLTKAEFQEKGGDYFKQHLLSNWYLSTTT